MMQLKRQTHTLLQIYTLQAHCYKLHGFGSELRCTTGAVGHTNILAMFYYRFGLKISTGVNKYDGQQLLLQRGTEGINTAAFSLTLTSNIQMVMGY